MISLTRQRHILIGCIIIGAVLRLIYLFEIERIPFFYHPVADAKIYVDRAMEIYRGDIVPESVSFHSSPIYPYYIAATYAIGETLATPRVVQMLTGLANIVIVYLIALNLFGVIPALIAAFVMSVYPVFIYFEGDLMMIPLILFTINLSCLMFVRYQMTRARKYLIGAGIFLGLSAMGKPDTIMIAPFMALYILLTEGTVKRGLVRACMLAVWVTVTISPITITNILALNDFVLLTSNGGVNFYIGNHSGADGMFHLPEESGLWDHKLYLSSKEVAEKSMGKPLTSGEVSRFWFDKATAFITDKPLEFLSLTGKKIMLMINRYEISNHHSFYFFGKWSNVLTFNPLRLGILVALGLIGIVLSLRNWRRFVVVYIYLGVSFWVIVFFFVTARYRLPTVPFYILFGSYAIHELWQMARTRQIRRIVLLLIPALMVYALTFVRFPEFGGTYNQDLHNLGNVYMDLKQYDKALRCYLLVRKRNPKSPFNHYNVANIYQVQGKTEMAISEFLREIEVNPEFADSYINLSQIYMKQGKLEKARDYLEQALQVERVPSVMVNLGYIHYQLGNVPRALELFEQAFILAPDNPTVLRNLITLHESTGNLKKAAEYKQRLERVE